jgi:tetratricopeptide (TPR) repeat protein
MIVALVIRAARTDALVVQSFRVPPAMAAKGLSGEVVATQILDKLAEMQAASESTRAASSYDNNWENDLKIDIPNTGATTDQVWKLLRGWLGKETRISGEIIDTKGGLALTTRVGGTPGQRFVSATGDLDELVGKGAEMIYRETQPYRAAVYLTDLPGRGADRIAMLTRLTSNPSPMERKWAYNGLSVTKRREGDFVAAIAMAERALAIDPTMIPSLGNLGSAHTALGHDQAAIDAYRKGTSQKLTEEYDPAIVKANHCSERGEIGIMMFDPVMVDQSTACLEATSASMGAYAASQRIDASLLRHDGSPAALFRQAPLPGSSPDDNAVINAIYRLRAQMERGAGPALAAALADYGASSDKRNAKPESGYYRGTLATYRWPLEADALLVLGQVDDAAARIADTPLDCYSCLVMRGKIAAAQRDPMAAQRWFKEAVRQGPSLPRAYFEWGRLLADHGKVAAAELRLTKATQLSPNWADPLKVQGDLLARQGKKVEAIAKYDEALKRAPKWQELRVARARLN